MPDPDLPPPRFWRELLRVRATHRWGNFSWVSLNTLLQSANDKIAKFDATIVDSRRMRWIAAQRERGIDPFAPIEMPGARTLVALGDPGEMDASQYVLVRDLMSVKPHVLLLMSDIVYPAGDINAWRDAVYLPYFGLPDSAWTKANEAWHTREPSAVTPVPVPSWKVFASPGNHDWYDGLTGFMFHTSGAEPLPTLSYSNVGLTFVQRLTRRLWQHPAPPDRDMLEPLRARVAQRWASAPGPMPWQPAPYFTLDLGKAGADAAVRIVSVDTGIDGSIDIEQALWLQQALAGNVPKIVITGKPIVVGDEIRDLPVNAGPATAVERGPELKSVRALVAAGQRVIASVAGDIHNSQRVVMFGEVSAEAADDCIVRLRPSDFEQAQAASLPPVQIVAGGGGAFLSATHRTPYTAEGGLQLRRPNGDAGPTVPSGSHAYYPTREQSVNVFANRAGRGAGLVAIAVGALLMAAAAGLAVLAHRAVQRGEELGPSDPGSPDANPPYPSDVCVSGACLDQLYVLLAPVVLVALAGAAALLVHAVTHWSPPSGRTRALLALGLGLAAVAAVLLWLGRRVPLSDLPVVLGALAVALLAPLLPVLVPLIQAFPAIGRLIPLRAVAVAAAGLAVTYFTNTVTLSAVVVFVALAVPLLVGANWAIGRLLRKSDDWAIDRQRPWLRGFLAAASIWPILLILAAIWALPQDRTGDPGSWWQNAREPAAMIVLVELLLLLGWLLFMAAKTLWTARAAAPRWLGWVIGLGAPVLGVVAFVLAEEFSAETGWAALAGVGVALACAILAVGVVLAVSTDSVEESAITAALRARDTDGAGPARDRHLFRRMIVAATPGISEIAEASHPPFYKSFLRISFETEGGRTTAVCFEAYGVEDEPPPNPVGPPDPARGASVIDTLRIELPAS
jgi:hypothetical protein